jgi:hypothetical protein
MPAWGNWDGAQRNGSSLVSAAFYDQVDEVVNDGGGGFTLGSRR